MKDADISRLTEELSKCQPLLQEKEGQVIFYQVLAHYHYIIQQVQEKFAVRFKRAETTDKFKREFDSCVHNVEQVISSVPAYSDLKATDLWECSVCMVMNPVEDDICVACRTPKMH